MNPFISKRGLIYNSCNGSSVLNADETDYIHNLTPKMIMEKYGISLNDLKSKYDEIPLGFTILIQNGINLPFRFVLNLEGIKDNADREQKAARYMLLSIPQVLKFWEILNEIHGCDGPEWHCDPFGWISFTGVDGYGYNIDILGRVEKEELA